MLIVGANSFQSGHGVLDQLTGKSVIDECSKH